MCTIHYSRTPHSCQSTLWGISSMKNLQGMTLTYLTKPEIHRIQCNHLTILEVAHYWRVLSMFTNLCKIHITLKLTINILQWEHPALGEKAFLVFRHSLTSLRIDYNTIVFSKDIWTMILCVSPLHLIKTNSLLIIF